MEITIHNGVVFIASALWLVLGIAMGKYFAKKKAKETSDDEGITFDDEDLQYYDGFLSQVPLNIAGLDLSFDCKYKNPISERIHCDPDEGREGEGLRVTVIAVYADDKKIKARRGDFEDYFLDPIYDAVEKELKRDKFTF